MPEPRKRGKYLGFVAHEIKNPLATALWSCDLLRRMGPEDRGGERADKMIEVSLRALRRMRRLIDDFFTIERLLEQGYDLKRDRLGLRDLVSGSMQLLAEKDGISSQGWQLEAGDEATSGDPDMLRRAVRLALEHVARAAPGQRLSVAVAGAVALGALPLGAARATPPTTPRYRVVGPRGDAAGAVLGFALASRILEAHGGRIEERDGALRLLFPPAA